MGVHSWTGVGALLAPRVVHTTHPSIADAGNSTTTTTTIAMINVYHFFELEKNSSSVGPRGKKQ